MTDHLKNLEKYLQKILEFRHLKKDQLTFDELKKIAYEMGMTDTDWHYLVRSFEAHLARGNGFFKYRDWDDAIAEMEQALAINPFHEGAIVTVSLAYANRYRDYERTSDRQHAEEYARRCLEINPSNEQALQVLSSLRKEHVQRKITEKESLRTLIVAASLGVLVFAGLAYLSWSSPFSSGYRQQMAHYEDSHYIKVGAKSYAQSSGMDVPIHFVHNTISDGLTFDLVTSEFRDYGDEYSYSMKAAIKINHADVKLLKLRIELMDAYGKTLMTHYKNVIDQYTPIGKQGDVLPFYFIEMIKQRDIPDFKEVKVTVEEIEKQIPIG